MEAVALQRAKRVLFYGDPASYVPHDRRLPREKGVAKQNNSETSKSPMYSGGVRFNTTEFSPSRLVGMVDKCIYLKNPSGRLSLLRGTLRRLIGR
jgi:hypothetical protein